MDSLRTVSVLFILGIGVLFATGASGSQIIYDYGPQLQHPGLIVNNSHLMVRGEVTKIDPDGGISVFEQEETHSITLRVLDVYKGEIGDSLTAQIRHIPGMDNFSVGEEVILGVRSKPASSYPFIDTLYYQKGTKFTVTNNTVQITNPVTTQLSIDEMTYLIQHPNITNRTHLNIPDNITEDAAEASKPTNTATHKRNNFFTQLWASITAFFSYN